MKHFIVCVDIVRLDRFNNDVGQIAQTFVPVKAMNRKGASIAAVKWHGDTETVYENNHLQWTLDESCRNVRYTATRCTEVSLDELEQFLSVTKGLLNWVVVTDSQPIDDPS